jgi:hypothetical protein
VVLGSWFLVLGSGRPRTQDACGSRFLVPGSRFGTPAHPACAGLRVCGRDARAPRGHVVLGSWFLVLGSGRPRTQGRAGLRVCGRGRPRTQGARGSRFLVLGSRFGTPAPPGCAWFSVITGMVRDWCQAGSGLSYCCPPGPCHISGRETETTNSFATTSRRSVARASCSMSCLARNTPLPR